MQKSQKKVKAKSLREKKTHYNLEVPSRKENVGTVLEKLKKLIFSQKQ